MQKINGEKLKIRLQKQSINSSIITKKELKPINCWAGVWSCADSVYSAKGIDAFKRKQHTQIVPEGSDR